MPINKNLQTVFRKYGTMPFTVIPNEILEMFKGNSDAIAMYMYLSSKPDNWKPVKADIMKALGIGNTKYTKAKNLLEQAGMWHIVEVRNDAGQIQGRVIWFNQWVDSTEVHEIDTLANSTEVLKNHVSVNPHLGKTDFIVNKDSLVSKDTKKRKRALKRSSPISNDFWPDDEQLEAMGKRVKGVQIGTETEKFVNYYLGTGRSMKDWSACWRNWILKAAQFQEERR